MMALNDLLAGEFDEITEFLAEHRWVFDFKLTRIFQDDVLDKIPEEWTETFTSLSPEQLTQLPFGNIQQTWPKSFKCFIESCMRFSLPRGVTDSCPQQNQVLRREVASLRPYIDGDYVQSVGKTCLGSVDQNLSRKEMCGDTDFKTAGSAVCRGENDLKREITQESDIFTRFTPLDICEIDSAIRKGMSDKKMHEVCRMTSLIDHVTRVVGNNGVVDVGSGLGYLGQVLHCNYGNRVLGLEGKHGHTTGADKRLNKCECSHQLYNVTCELYQDTQSQQEFMFLVKDWFSKLKGSRCSHQKTGTKTSQTVGSKCPQTGSSRIQKQLTAAKSIQTDTERIAHLTGSANSHTGSTNNQTYSTYVQPGYTNNQTGSTNIQTGSTNNQTGSKISLETGTPTSAEKKSLTGSNKSECKQTDSEAELKLEVQTGLEETETSESETNNNPNTKRRLSSEHSIEECADNQIEQSYHSIGNDKKSVEKCKASLNSDIPQLCMVGLHCCGDLTPTMLKYFVDLNIITSLCCVSCCYHRMNYNEDSQEHDNFPMSKLLKESVVKTLKNFPDFKFTSYCLRLAAQETRARWHKQTQKDHEYHMMNVAYRGVLETCLQQAPDRFKLKKCVRKLAHKDDYQSFTRYIDTVFKHIEKPDGVSVEEFKELFHTEILQKYDLYNKYFSLIEPLTGLQYLVQPVIESLIYLDRKQWLKEQGYNAHIVPVFNELISPRNLALIACKQHPL